MQFFMIRKELTLYKQVSWLRPYASCSFPHMQWRLKEPLRKRNLHSDGIA